MGMRTVNNVIPEVISLEQRDEMLGWYYSFKGTHKGLVLDKRATDGRALWWDCKVNRMFMSDSVFERVSALGVEGFQDNPRIDEQ